MDIILSIWFLYYHFIELIFQNFVSHIQYLFVFRVLRLFRIARLFKFNRYFSGGALIFEAFGLSTGPLILLLFSILLTCIFFSSFMFYAEQTVSTFDMNTTEWRYADGMWSPFQSIFHCFWWCIVTITTVGYGDIYPHSTLGKIIASFTMVCGILMLAFPLTIIASNFSELYGAKKRKESMKTPSEIEEELAQSKRSKHELFKFIGDKSNFVESKIEDLEQEITKLKTEMTSLRVSLDYLRSLEEGIVVEVHNVELHKRDKKGVELKSDDSDT